MGETFGRRVVDTAGRSIQVTADGRPEFKAGGVTIDWSTVAAVSGSDVTLNDGVTVKVGEKYLRYGQVIQRITASGKFGPYDPAAADGREAAPSAGNSYWLNETIVESEIASDHPPAAEGGLVFRDRLIVHATTANLANGPTLATFKAAFPRTRFVLE